MSNDVPDNQTDLDSQADSPMVGRNALVFETIDTAVQVKGFTPSLGTKTVPIVNATVSYDNLFHNKVIILLIYNALYIKEMEHNLIPPFVMRLAQLDLDKEPKFPAKNPTLEHHSMFFPRTNTRLHFRLHSIVSYLPTCLLTPEEFNEVNTQIELKPPSALWNSHDPRYEDQEANMLDYRGQMALPSERRPVAINNKQTFLAFEVNSVSLLISKTIEPWSLDAALTTQREYQVKLVASGECCALIIPEEFANTWAISLDTAKSTIQETTQRLVRSMITPTFNHRYNTNNRMLRYKCLSCPMFTDTYFAAKNLGPSIRGFQCSKIFATNFGYVAVWNMKR